MRYETYTYVCYRNDGFTEYGFTFKLSNSDDCEFDLVLGAVPEGEEVKPEMWSKYAWAAEAIVSKHQLIQDLVS